MHKRIIAVLALATVVAGCSKSSSTTSEQATSAAATGAASTDATSSAGTAASDAPAAVAGAGGAYTPIVLPIYPGATLRDGSHAKITEDADVLIADSYETKDSAATVAAWYQAHLPADWNKALGEPGKKITGVFTSPTEGENEGQTVSVIGGEPGTPTEIDLSTKTPSK